MPSYVRAGIRKCARIRALSLSHSRNDGNKFVQPVALLTDGSENVDGFSKEVDDAIEDCRLNMDSEEAQNRLLVIMYKAMDLAREIRALSEANI